MGIDSVCIVDIDCSTPGSLEAMSMAEYVPSEEDSHPNSGSQSGELGKLDMLERWVFMS
jgi:hypothetical protein